MGVTEVKDIQNFYKTINQDKYTVFDFWATWCGPCRVISPIFEQLAEKFPDIAFHKVDIDAEPAIAEEVGISAMPTFILFKSGSKIDELVGANPARLEALIARAK